MIMIHHRLAAALAVMIALLAAAGTDAAPETLGEWLARDTAAGRLPPSPARDAELEALQRMVVAGLRSARAAEETRSAAGQSPLACLPPPGSVELTSQEIGIWLHARPADEQGETMARAMTRFLAARFMCNR